MLVFCFSMSVGCESLATGRLPFGPNVRGIMGQKADLFGPKDRTVLGKKPNGIASKGPIIFRSDRPLDDRG